MTLSLFNEILKRLTQIWQKMTTTGTSVSAIETSSATTATESTNISRNSDYQNWTTIAGNSIEYTYYPSSTPGTDPNNPSGNTGNVATKVYKEGVTTRITQTYTYDSSDLVLSVTTS